MAERLSFRLMNFKFFIPPNNVGIPQSVARTSTNLLRPILRRKSVENEFPFRTGAGRTQASFGRRRPDHGNAHHVAERERQLAGLTMTLPFMFGWIEHK
jgi:hypothetical protein